MLEPRGAGATDQHAVTKRSEIFGENLNPTLNEDKLKAALKKESAFQANKGQEVSKT